MEGTEVKVTKKYLLVAAMATTGLVLSSCAPSAGNTEPDDTAASGSAAASEPVNVGIIYSETGPLAAYGEAYRYGFEAGLDYATDGTGEVNGQPIEITYMDDAGDVDTAIAHAKTAIGEGTKIIGGTVVSGVALALAEQAEQNQVLYVSGPAAADAVTGINDYTFRSGRQSLQDVATAGTFIDPDGQTVYVFAQDNAFGQGNLAAVEAVLGAQGATVESILVPEDATEFTPFAAQLLDADPDLVFAAWAGATSGAMWEALDQQGVFDAAPVVTGLGDKATYGAYGVATEQISFLSHYFPSAPDNEVNAAMLEHIEAAGGVPDLFSPDGFVGAQMIVHAIEEGQNEPDAMVDALEGWTFDGPKGETTVRASDHALIQDMYQAQLTQVDGEWVAELIETVPAEEVAPPEM